ncbi:16S rRNA (adenine(1518)-N(6)/adenine(1519)-N(6))-dimethyltransferase RsmA [Gordonia alkanivorans]|uniref:16S rRNA (adenine(1518)-N(6)/adenine(1519)-N(6))- dimethyltransferase RsmA n=1 Tax=Gordonia alkanivorans TaxID=84096 RepID=UPI000FDEB266|nr:16S rRNA (adenine(1518)-N(6)/adenine(1519)-N(6))-dimethyltransferase RsmA [Gordonia alkanivorans]AZZ83116.1 16S rRNA (adenine(1518)-N(6)/adenine(1519)-N(6))-dimethyltransferase [Gordonia alkanivorans]MDH3022850.1 16S rRNA (adenine(1518)-N(6)/adenine(1519)-N(6))-dimethyltransferase RsmA [Gordonia alkanivorans]
MAVVHVQVGPALNDDTPGDAPRLLGPAQIRDLAAEVGVRPTKTLGQNFVHDANTVRRIVTASGVGSDDVVLEVGPGLGSLTLALLGTAGRVVAIEIDPILAQRIPQTVAEYAPARSGNFDVVLADALQVTRDDLPVVPTALVANLPYNVSVPVLLHLLGLFPEITTALVMVQAEVADRLAAPPGSRTYGVPSVKARYHGRVSRAGAVGRNVFWPEPKVESGLVRIERTDDYPIDPVFRRTVFAVIDAAFAQRRKTMRSALAGWAGSPAEAERRLRAADIDPGIRGEKLDVDDFVRLARTV